MKLILQIIEYFQRQRAWVSLTVALVVAAIIGLFDFVTGQEAFFAVFYLLPIAFVTWLVGIRWGVSLAMICAALCAVVSVLNDKALPSTLLLTWNTGTRLAVFLIVAYLLSALRQAYEQERQLARTDHLTGAANLRSFCDILEQELHRFRRYRHPFTLMYADLDNFKAVNDQMGHGTGDAVLREVVVVFKQNVRPSDIVARLGGDEFALLLPETGHGTGHEVAERLQRSLLEEMQRLDLPITVSFGVITCAEAPMNVSDLLRIADDLMYSVKESGKNGIRHETLEAKAVA